MLGSQKWEWKVQNCICLTCVHDYAFPLEQKVTKTLVNWQGRIFQKDAIT